MSDTRCTLARRLAELDRHDDAVIAQYLWDQIDVVPSDDVSAVGRLLRAMTETLPRTTEGETTPS